MARKIQAYVDAPIREHRDLHTGGIAYVVYAPYVDDEVRCVTLVDHEGDKHERVFTESEVMAILRDLLAAAEDGPFMPNYDRMDEVVKFHGLSFDPA